MIKRYEKIIEINDVESEHGSYVLYSDFLKIISKLKTGETKELMLCKTCKWNKMCNPHNNYGIIAMVCKKYIKRKLKK